VRVAGQRPVKVRLAGIDAPERDQPFGQRRRQSLSELAFGQPATVMVQKTDEYGRTVGTVTVGGVNVEAEQVRRGLAWVYRKYSDDARRLALEAEAKAARRGLWADANPMPPWAWRHGGQAATRPEPAPVPAEFGGALRGKTHLRRNDFVRGGAVLSHAMWIEPAGWRQGRHAVRGAVSVRRRPTQHHYMVFVSPLKRVHPKPTAS